MQIQALLFGAPHMRRHYVAHAIDQHGRGDVVAVNAAVQRVRNHAALLDDIFGGSKGCHLVFIAHIAVRC